MGTFPKLLASKEKQQKQGIISRNNVVVPFLLKIARPGSICEQVGTIFLVVGKNKICINFPSQI